MFAADLTFIWKVVDSPKRFETGLKLSETVGRQQYLPILHLSKEVWMRNFRVTKF